MDPLTPGREGSTSPKDVFKYGWTETMSPSSFGVVPVDDAQQYTDGVFVRRTRELFLTDSNNDNTNKIVLLVSEY